MYSVKNYTEQGGETWVIGGTLKIGGSIVNEEGAALIANQAASTASAVDDLKTDFNALLTKLKASGLMVADA
jgi:hypothetical protein